VYQQLGLGELKPTSTVLQLADRSIKKPQGIVEDVLVKVDKFYYLVDFIFLDTEPVPYPDKQILVIHGRPFLATTNACINCRTGVMKISFGNIKIRLNIFTAFQNAPDQRSVSSWMILEKLLKTHRLKLYLKPHHGETH
jgi:hypothetical protein